MAIAPCCQQAAANYSSASNASVAEATDKYANVGKNPVPQPTAPQTPAPEKTVVAAPSVEIREAPDPQQNQQTVKLSAFTAQPKSLPQVKESQHMAEPKHHDFVRFQEKPPRQFVQQRYVPQDTRTFRDSKSPELPKQNATLNTAQPQKTQATPQKNQTPQKTQFDSPKPNNEIQSKPENKAETSVKLGQEQHKESSQNKSHENKQPVTQKTVNSQSQLQQPQQSSSEQSAKKLVPQQQQTQQQTQPKTFQQASQQNTTQHSPGPMGNTATQSSASMTQPMLTLLAKQAQILNPKLKTLEVFVKMPQTQPSFPTQAQATKNILSQKAVETSEQTMGNEAKKVITQGKGVMEEIPSESAAQLSGLMNKLWKKLSRKKKKSNINSDDTEVELHVEGDKGIELNIYIEPKAKKSIHETDERTSY